MRRERAMAGDGGRSRRVLADAKSAIVSLPIFGTSVRDIQVVDLATGASTGTQLDADDISWQRLAQP